ATIQLALEPVITRQPQSRIVAADSSAVLNVKASGTPPLNYTWRRGGTDVPGANSFQLQTGQAGDYRVVIQNNYGAVTSDVATVTIQDPPSVTQQPTGGTVLAGTT